MKVLITGVGRGLGKALALELAKRGHTVIGCSLSTDLLSSLQSELASASEHKSNNNQHLTMNVDVVVAVKWLIPTEDRNADKDREVGVLYSAAILGCGNASRPEGDDERGRGTMASRDWTAEQNGSGGIFETAGMAQVFKQEEMQWMAWKKLLNFEN